MVEQVLRGGQHAFSLLVKRHQRYVFNLVLQIVRNRELAEELCQDVFVKAYRFLGDFRGKSKFSTWLYRIAHNTCYSHMRVKKKSGILLGDEKLTNISDKLQQQHSDVLELRSRESVITAALGKLPAGDQEIISLYYHGEQSVREIGIIMGISESNVKIRLHRCRQKLKEQLEELYDEIQT